MGVRQVQRLANRYREYGAAGLLSKRRGQPSHRRYPAQFREYDLATVRSHDAHFGPTLAAEKLHELHDITFSIGTLRAWMSLDELWTMRK